MTATPGQPFSTPHDALDVYSGRPTFALTGPSVVLDPRTHAVRGDLADVRLAGEVFASHYAAAMPCVAVRSLPVRDQAHDGTVVAELAAGDRFDVLELAGDHAWGLASAAGLIGYCDRHALKLA